MLTVRDYFMTYIDKKVDLAKTPKICCPFHHEKTPSFSYTIKDGEEMWRCFGSCKFGGGVVELHMKATKSTREEAEMFLGLRRMHEEDIYLPKKKTITLNMAAIEEARKLKRSNLRVGNSTEISQTQIDEWLALDYEASIYLGGVKLCMNTSR